MITPATPVVTTQYTADLGGVTHLVVFRQSPFNFRLLSFFRTIRSPHMAYINNDYSMQGSIDLINHIRTLAIAQSETWSNEQLVAASMANTIYIKYDSFDSITLLSSTDTLTQSHLEAQFPNSQIWSSNDATEQGLTDLVDLFLLEIQA